MKTASRMFFLMGLRMLAVLLAATAGSHHSVLCATVKQPGNKSSSILNLNLGKGRTFNYPMEVYDAERSPSASEIARRSLQIAFWRCRRRPTSGVSSGIRRQFLQRRQPRACRRQVRASRCQARAGRRLDWRSNWLRTVVWSSRSAVLLFLPGFAGGGG